ncbi:MAG: tripartite tricarboxylate transporter substrate binding protein [Lautropia sp.]
MMNGETRARTRRRIIGAIGGGAVACALGAAATSATPAIAAETADAYPSKQIRIVVPYPPGGFNDTLARTFAEHLQADWKQSVVVDNKPGGNTLIGNGAVANAAPDGYTLLITPLPFAALPGLYSAKLPYDALKSFDRVIWAGSTQNVLGLRKGFPAKNVAELIDYAKKNPGKINFASTGSGSSNHLSMELFMAMTGTKMVHIPYKGSAPARTALAAGEVDVLFDNTPNLLPLVQAGRVDAIAVTSLKRSALLPDVPTVDESGVKGYEVDVWFGVQAPSGTPKPVIAKLNAKMVEILKTPKVVEAFRKQGVEVAASTPERFEALVRSEIEKWGKLVRDAGIRIE